MKYIIMCMMAMLAIVTQAQDDVLYNVSSTPASDLEAGQMYVLKNSRYPLRTFYIENGSAQTTDVYPILGSVRPMQNTFHTAGADGFHLSITLPNVNDDNDGGYGYGNTGGGTVLAPPRRAPMLDPITYFTVRDAAGQYVMIGDNGKVYGINSANPAENALWEAYLVTEHHHEWQNGKCTVCFKLCQHPTVKAIGSSDRHQCTVCYAYVEHNWNPAAGTCKTCGQECSHRGYMGGKCVDCGMACHHTTYVSVGDIMHQCQVCHENTSYHVWEDGVCIVCGHKCKHQYQDDYCVYCNMEKKPTIAGTIEFDTPTNVDFPSLIVGDNIFDKSAPTHNPTSVPLYRFVIEEPGNVIISFPEIDKPRYGITIFKQDFKFKVASYYTNSLLYYFSEPGEYYMMLYTIVETEAEEGYQNVPITLTFSSLGLGTLHVGNSEIDLTSQESIDTFNATAPGKMSVDFYGSDVILSLQDCSIESDGEGGIVLDSPMYLEIDLTGDNSIRPSAQSTAETFYGIKTESDLAVFGPGSLAIDATIGVSAPKYLDIEYGAALNVTSTSHAIEMTSQNRNVLYLWESDINLCSSNGNGINFNGEVHCRFVKSNLEITTPEGAAISIKSDDNYIEVSEGYCTLSTVWAGNSKAEASVIAENIEEDYVLDLSAVANHYFSVKYKDLHDINGDGQIDVADIIAYLRLGDKAPLFGYDNREWAIIELQEYILYSGSGGGPL